MELNGKVVGVTDPKNGMISLASKQFSIISSSTTELFGCVLKTSVKNTLSYMSSGTPCENYMRKPDLTQKFLFHRMLTDNFGDKYEKYSLTSEWKGVTAGGCINNNTWYKVSRI